MNRIMTITFYIDYTNAYLRYMIPISSSLLSGIKYESGNLTVFFRDGRNYVYHNVPKKVFEQFKNSPSKGKFYNQYIKGCYQ